jgi:serine/threonine protein kinase
MSTAQMYHSGGDLCTAIAADDVGELRWYNRGHQVALDIARGLYFLHSHDVSLCSASPVPLADAHDDYQHEAGVLSCYIILHLDARTCDGSPTLWMQVMHLDLKTKNVLLTADMVGKVTAAPPAATLCTLWGILLHSQRSKC